MFFYDSIQVIIHQRSLYNHPPAGLLTRGKILVSREGDYVAIFIDKFRSVLTKSGCDLVYAVAKCTISRHMDHVPKLHNHVTFRTHFNGLIVSLYYTL